MKKQYFGDIRDLFKYDLVQQLLEHVPQFKRCLFVPMLTSDDDSREGNKINYSVAKAGTRNHDLVCSLKKCLREKKRDVVEIESYFRTKGFKFVIYKKDGKEFEHWSRKEYFKGLRALKGDRTLVLVDPDIGLEVKRSGKKHILLEEVQDLFHWMSTDSALMIFDFIPRMERRAYFKQRQYELMSATGASPILISDNQVIFFFLAKGKALKQRIAEIIRAYKQMYPKLVVIENGFD